MGGGGTSSTSVHSTLKSGLNMLRSLEESSGSSGGIERRAGDCVPLRSSARVQELASKMATVLRCKQQGNTAFQQRDYAGAERHYTAALAVRGVAAPFFSAVLYSNRVAVHMVRNPRFISLLPHTVSADSSGSLKGHSVTRYNPFCMEKGGFETENSFQTPL